jgi:hypothetical protein
MATTAFLSGETHKVALQRNRQTRQILRRWFPFFQSKEILEETIVSSPMALEVGLGSARDPFLFAGLQIPIEEIAFSSSSP